jgi:prepilin-type N-terminal cleavage/methylation domain-containing protein
MTVPARNGATGQAGFTLVEVLVAMTLTLVVASLALGVFEAFDRGVAANSRLTDAQDTSRRELGLMVRTLREAGAPAGADGVLPTAVTRSDDNDIVFRSRAWPGEADTGSNADHLQRFCLNTTTKILWFDGKHASTPGDDDPGSACPSTAPGWTRHRPPNASWCAFSGRLSAAGPSAQRGYVAGIDDGSTSDAGASTVGL